MTKIQAFSPRMPHVFRVPGLLALASLSLMAGACHGGPDGDMPGDSNDRAPFHAIAARETIHFTGTEPFWSGEVAGGRLTYATPEDPKGRAIPVTRFAGRGGLSFSGNLDGRALVLAVTPDRCSDGMSDRVYPLVVTLQLGEELRQGCGWTARQPWRARE